jgi:hypothetical protein
MQITVTSKKTNAVKPKWPAIGRQSESRGGAKKVRWAKR